MIEPTLPKDPQVFLSFAGPDREIAVRLHDALERQRVPTFMSDLDLPPGADIVHTIDCQLEESDYCLLLWSAHAKDRPWVRAEYSAALARELAVVDRVGAFLFVLCLDDTPMPSLLQPRKHLSAVNAREVDAAAETLAGVWRRDWRQKKVLRAPASFPPTGAAQVGGRSGQHGRCAWIEVYVRNQTFDVAHLVQVPPPVTGHRLHQAVTEELLLPDGVSMADRAELRFQYDLLIGDEVILDDEVLPQVGDGTALDLVVHVEAWNGLRATRAWTLRGDDSATSAEAVTCLRPQAVRVLLDQAFGHLAPRRRR